MLISENLSLFFAVSSFILSIIALFIVLTKTLFYEAKNGERWFDFVSFEEFWKNIGGDKDDAQIIYDKIKAPSRSTQDSAGYDFFSPFDIILQPGQEIVVASGIRTKMMKDEFLAIFPRSGQGFKFFIRLANTVGIVDSDYYFGKNEGHIFIKLRNEGTKTFKVSAGDAIAQGIFMKFLKTMDDNLFTKQKRNGGFGSTSK